MRITRILLFIRAIDELPCPISSVAMDTKTLLAQGILAAQRNLPDKARELFNLVLIAEPRNENAWLWLSSIAADDAEREECLRQVVAINPQHPTAVNALKELVEQRRAVLSAKVAGLAAVQAGAIENIAPVPPATPRKARPL